MAIRLSNPAALQRILSRPSRLIMKQNQASPIISNITIMTQRSYYSTEQSEPSPPPLLTKMKGDLKTAMRAKDTTRLSVLRSVLAAALNASKTASPIRTDAQLVALLRKQAQASQDAIDGFKAAGRDDLVEKESAQVKVLLDYAAESGVQVLSEQDLETLAGQAREQVAAAGDTLSMGNLMKMLAGPGGLLEGKDFDKTAVAKIVKKIAA
ncbi:Yqey-like domain containing protein [Rhypophila sp. PSN 637]